MKRRLLAAVAAWVLLPGAADADEALRETVREDYRAYLATLFEHFHRNPELSFRETATAARIAEELRNVGVEVTEGVGGTGVVGMLRHGNGPTVLVRADMDGLPILEDSGLPYASTASQEDITGEVVPVMHACGSPRVWPALPGCRRTCCRRWSCPPRRRPRR